MPKHGKRSIPERWEAYSPIGKRIQGTRFIAFKVPLKWELCKNLPKDLWFTPATLMNKVHNLGLIIDLTNTARYYLPKEFTDHHIKYFKVKCEGKKVPAEHIVERFSQLVAEYSNVCKDTDTLIGVHCTHGVNRTGYLICRYMIEQMGFSPLSAIHEFNKARGFDMERFNYLDSLMSCKEKFDNCEQATYSDAQWQRQQSSRHGNTLKARSARGQCSRLSSRPYPQRRPRGDWKRQCDSSDQQQNSRRANPAKTSAGNKRFS